MVKKRTIKISTDTATLAVFDPDAARPYMQHECHDWWTIWEHALAATNAGDVAIVDLGTDGNYVIELVDPHELPSEGRLEIELRCPSGTFYVGPGEYIPADGLEPDEHCAGKFVYMGKERARCLFHRLDEHTVQLGFASLEGEPVNTFTEPTRLRIDL